MNKAKLMDVHNRVNGEGSGGFTREGRDIQTQIDRIYARENNSRLAWDSSEVDHSIVANTHTDHSPAWWPQRLPWEGPRARPHKQR